MSSQLPISVSFPALFFFSTCLPLAHVGINKEWEWITAFSICLQWVKVKLRQIGCSSLCWANRETTEHVIACHSLGNSRVSSSCVCCVIVFCAVGGSGVRVSALLCAVILIRLDTVPKISSETAASFLEPWGARGALGVLEIDVLCLIFVVIRVQFPWPLQISYTPTLHCQHYLLASVGDRESMIQSLGSCSD